MSEPDSYDGVKLSPDRDDATHSPTSFDLATGEAIARTNFDASSDSLQEADTTKFSSTHTQIPAPHGTLSQVDPDPTRHEAITKVPYIISFGATIPTGAFRTVQITVVDEDGEPLEERPVWLIAKDYFPTAAPVQGVERDPEDIEDPDDDDSVTVDEIATIRLLEGFRYDEFSVAVLPPYPEDREGALIWYDQAEPAQVEPGDEEKTVRFKEAETPRTVVIEDVDMEVYESTPLDITG